jgi:hypothetical protein
MGGIGSLLTAKQEDIDSAKRISDTVNDLCLRLDFDERRRSWLAFSLQEGKWDGNVYPTRRDAVRHQSNEFYAIYISMNQSMGGMDTNAAYVVLMYHRLAYNAGFRLPDPDHKAGGKHLVMPLPKEDIVGQLGAMLDASARGIRGYSGR